MDTVTIVGAGLAGCEAALRCRGLGVPVRLVEMRPIQGRTPNDEARTTGTRTRMTEAHETGDVAELVCSNSLKSDEPGNAHGLLKAELRLLGSALLPCAERAGIPGGKALVVDRRRFSAEVQRALDGAGIEVTRQELTSVPDSGPAVIATGPLTSPALADALSRLLGAERLFFYDAIAPVVAADSVDGARVFAGSRYGSGSDYLNSAMTEDEYDRFVQALAAAELHPLHDFEKAAAEGEVPGDSPGVSARFFEGCLPVEEMARRGRMVLAFGPMKPVGLTDPRTGHRPFAVVQLRRENAAGTMLNLVGFQTRLRHAEQERVFRMIPGLGRARFLRFGGIHRNTFLDAPRVLAPTLQARARPDLFIAGQLTGVEGYVESVGAGLLAGANAARLARGEEPVVPPPETMLGSLVRYITTPNDDFQPMNANFGLLPELAGRFRGRDRRAALAERALAALGGFTLTTGAGRA